MLTASTSLRISGWICSLLFLLRGRNGTMRLVSDVSAYVCTLASFDGIVGISSVGRWWWHCNCGRCIVLSMVLANEESLRSSSSSSSSSQEQEHIPARSS